MPFGPGLSSEEKSNTWLARRVGAGRPPAMFNGAPIDPSTGKYEERPGQVYMGPHNEWGAPVGWLDSKVFEEKYNTGWTPAQMLVAGLPLALGGGQALAGLLGGGGGAASTAASSSIPSVSVTGGLPAGAFPTIAGTSGAGKMGLGGILSKVFGKGGIDPTALVLGGLSSLTGGGDGGGDSRQSFHKGVSPEAGALVDPIQSLYNALNAADRLGQFLNTRLSNGYNLRSSFVQPGPSPVNIPGLGFQIGGGLGTDPAFLDPTLLRSEQQAGSPAYSTVNTPPSPAQPRRRSR